ncbi:hypothetical protein ACFS07_22920 [Undibacterium arcticum]
MAAERHAANQHTPIFMAHGRGDPVIPIDRAEKNRATCCKPTATTSNGMNT